LTAKISLTANQFDGKISLTAFVNIIGSMQKCFDKCVENNSSDNGSKRLRSEKQFRVCEISNCEGNNILWLRVAITPSEKQDLGNIHCYFRMKRKVFLRRKKIVLFLSTKNIYCVYKN